MHFGYRVSTAANGAEAVSLYLLHQNEVTVVLTDMAMPVMDGPAAIAALKSINRDVHIIGTSGLGPAGGGEIEAGMDDFISKLQITDALLRALHGALYPKPGGMAPAPGGAWISQPALTSPIKGNLAVLAQSKSRRPLPILSVKRVLVL